MTLSPEQTVQRSLEALNREKSLFGTGILAAVSGGADSVALLALLHRFAPVYGYTLTAVTVDHCIRRPEESAGDARFAADLCRALDPPVVCHVVSLGEGEVARIAAERGRGTEEAARFSRYGHFERIADLVGARWIMTGHNQNDQLETVLMRILQGSGGSALAGIAGRRGRYVRPLLEASRPALVEWLTANSLSWREDASNQSDGYLRNRIRRHVLPALDQTLPGWKTGLATTVARARLDDDLCRGLITARWTPCDGRLECRAADFAALHPALRLRFLHRGLNLLPLDRRVPYGLLSRIVRSPGVWTGGATTGVVSGSGLRFAKEGDSLFWGPDIVQNTKSGYLIYIRSCGAFRVPFGTLTVSGTDGNVFLDGRLGPFRLPLTVRSRAAGDFVGAAGGKRKTLKKLMNDWSVPESDRNLLQVIEHAGSVRAVYGHPFGYPDWYVHI